MVKGLEELLFAYSEFSSICRQDRNQDLSANELLRIWRAPGELSLLTFLLLIANEGIQSS
jgi:hypothetical protein